MIEEISSRNDLLPLNNIHLLSVTDLLQREDCCCYIREGLLKMKIYTIQQRYLHTRSDQQSSHLFQRSQLLVVKFLRAIQFKWKRATQLRSRAALSIHSSTPQLSRSSLPPFGLRISLERTAFILLCCILSILSEPLYSVLILFWAHLFLSVLFISLCCSFSGIQAQSLVKRLVW